MGQLTTLFRQLYERHWPSFEAYLRCRPDLSSPLLIDPPDKYFNQRFRLFVVGQETRTWYNGTIQRVQGTTAINTLMHRYKDVFQLGMCKRRRSSFWEFVRAIERRLVIEPGAIVWSNINKVDRSGGRLEEGVAFEIGQLFPVIVEEVELSEANVVLFFTARRNDDRIQACFPGATFKDDERLENQISVVSHSLLPDKTYRTNHPRYLRTSGNWRLVLDRLVQLITAEEKKTRGLIETFVVRSMMLASQTRIEGPRHPPIDGKHLWLAGDRPLRRQNQDLLFPFCGEAP